MRIGLSPSPAGTRLLALAAVGLLSACSAGGPEDMQAWIAQQRARLSTSLETLPEPRPYVPEPYTQGALQDPFSPQRLAQALRRDEAAAAATSALVAPEINRRKEALEAYPLDALAMVGTLSRQGRLVALLSVDGRLYTVAPGQYLGQNFGRILRITPTELALREIVRDPAGAWVERQATLQLQQRTK